MKMKKKNQNKNENENALYESQREIHTVASREAPRASVNSLCFYVCFLTPLFWTNRHGMKLGGEPWK